MLLPLRTVWIRLIVATAFSGLLSNTFIVAQQTNPDEEPPKIPEISDEPKTVDPADLVPKPLAVLATVEFNNSSLRELVTWLEEQQLVVLLDNKALADEGISLGEPVSGHLDNAPIYLLLNRLSSLNLAWYMHDDILHITSTAALQERQSTEPYNVGDLLDDGYAADSLSEVITYGIAPDSWEENGGYGVIQLLGDVLFVRQNDAQHREVRGLLAALRKHGRRTLTSDPPQHLALHEVLFSKVTVEFDDTPLETAIESLADQANADIRLDGPALRAIRIRDREPVSLQLSDRRLRTVLQVMLSDLELTWVLRDGVLWVTSREAADELLKTAVFDVRDLCRDFNEQQALETAITSQTTTNWEEQGGLGTIYSPKAGTLVVRQTERSLDEVLDLLETYRTALRASKPRDRQADERKKVVTVYYQSQTQIAEDLERYLPRLLATDTWKTEAAPDAVGTILRIASTAEKKENQTIERSVLAIRQTREVHDDIAKLILRVENGDPRSSGGGMGGGGFGGGLFDVPSTKTGKK